MLAVKILGSGCANCRKLEAVARAAAEGAGMLAEFIKVTRHADILTCDILSIPALVINEQVMRSGRIPAQAKVAAWMRAA